MRTPPERCCREVRAQDTGGRPQQPVSQEAAADGGSGGGRGWRRCGGKAAVEREKRFGGVWRRCHWWAGPGGEVGGHALTRRSVCDDANRAQIWIVFASPRTPWLKYVGPMGWIFLTPVKIGPNRTTAVRLHQPVGDAVSSMDITQRDTGHIPISNECRTDKDPKKL
jgi:hypothetical protein